MNGIDIQQNYFLANYRKIFENSGNRKFDTYPLLR